jgi:hypothetical protein
MFRAQIRCSDANVHTVSRTNLKGIAGLKMDVWDSAANKLQCPGTRECAADKGRCEDGRLPCD